ncbi:MAG: M23 family metallopeptidase [Proteobacteria bacterium]|nr:M23 family metallopeptidase [Pseudomonadota bacterium]
MAFEEVKNQILKPYTDINGTTYYPDIFYDGGVRQDVNAPRKGGRKHNGVDFNYRDANGNRAPFINDSHPFVDSPVKGKITDVNNNWGIVEITDANGNRHRICHLDSWNVKKGDIVEAGQTIGQMGGRGDQNGDGIYGANEYLPHIDYKILGPKGQYIDPETYWLFPYQLFFLIMKNL